MCYSAQPRLCYSRELTRRIPSRGGCNAGLLKSLQAGAAPRSPLTAIALQRLADRAMTEMGEPGVLSLFQPKDDSVAARLVEDNRIAMISFTGSIRVGRWVAETVGRTLGRRYMLKCSGNNGCIVDETADLNLATRSITFGVVGTTSVPTL